MALRYRLLLLDHDDTTVDSTASIHYPAHVESVRALRPDLEPCSLRRWFEVVPPLLPAALPSLAALTLLLRPEPRAGGAGVPGDHLLPNADGGGARHLDPRPPGR